MGMCCALLPTITNLPLSKSWWLNRVSLSTSGWQKWSWFTPILCEQKWLGFSHLQGPLDGGGGRRLVSAPNSSGSLDALDSIFGMGQLCCEWHAYFTEWHGAAVAGEWSESTCVWTEVKTQLGWGVLWDGSSFNALIKIKTLLMAEFWALLSSSAQFHVNVEQKMDLTLTDKDAEERAGS